MRIGPGAMVAAAFIGPGTVVTAATAGATSGGALLWAVGFSVIATLVLQDLAARSALATRLDLASLIRTISQAQWWRLPLLGLVVVALGVGNSAYQSGNLTGAGLGIAIALDVPVSLIVEPCRRNCRHAYFGQSLRLAGEVLGAVGRFNGRCFRGPGDCLVS